MIALPSLINSVSCAPTAPAAMLLLTPSDRACRAFSHEWIHTLHTARTGVVAISLPRFLTIKSWFAELWHESQLFGLIDDVRSLLPPGLEAMLWQQVAQNTVELGVAASAPVAQLLSEAWQLEHGYANADASPTPYALGDNGHIYRSARRQFTQLLQRMNAISAAELPAALMRSASALTMQLPTKIVLTPAFAPIPAETQAIVALASAAGAHIQNLATKEEEINNVPRRYVFRDPTSEQRAAIAWAHEHLQSNAESLSAQPIAIVVPNLQQTRGHWERLLIDAGLDYNLSLGLTLSEYPWINTFFVVLRALWQSEATETLAQALRESRWTVFAERTNALSAREISLLQQAVYELNVISFIRGIDTVLADALAGLAAQVAHPARRQRSLWIEYFSLIVQCLGGDAQRVDSQLYQLQNAFNQVLLEWRKLDSVLSPLTIDSALTELRTLMDRHAFQPEGSTSPLQVIGLLESAGVPFSAMWVTGMLDTSLPEAVRPSPLLARDWQHKYNVGLAGYDQTTTRASHLVSGWRAMTGALTVSAAQEIDGEPCIASPLIRSLAVEPYALTSLNHAVLPDAQDERSLQVDETAPGWHSERVCNAGHLQAQAECPRQGFSRARLRLEDWPRRSDGLSPHYRGTVIHQVAEVLSRARMTGDGVGALSDQLPEIIDAVLVASQKKLPDINSLVWRVEADRLERVFKDFLHYEDNRSPFIVLAVETLLETEISGLRFRLRIDRVEAALDAEGKPLDAVFIIDFKSGVVRLGDLAESRLPTPQLPLYAQAWSSTQTRPVEALSFVQLSDDMVGYLGVGDEGNDFTHKLNKTMPFSFKELRQRWPNQLKTLASELVSGDAVIAPLHGQLSCKRCGLERFCRNNPLLLEDEINEGDA